MVKYSELTYSIDPKIVGPINGLPQLNMGPEFMDINKWYNDIFMSGSNNKDSWKKRSTMTKNGHDIFDIEIKKTAKVTDIMIVSIGIGLFVNDRAKKILEQFNLPNHRYYNTNFTKHNTNTDKYWWLVYDLETGKNTVDYSESIFDLSWHQTNFKNHMTINSYDDYMNLYHESGRAAIAKKIVLNQNFDTNLDLWGFQFHSMNDKYISEKLASCLVESRINGFDIIKPKCELVTK